MLMFCIKVRNLLLAAFVQMLRNYRETPVRSHLAALYGMLLEQVVEIKYIAQQAGKGGKTLKQSTLCPLRLLTS
jgi:hypothetical protein